MWTAHSTVGDRDRCAARTQLAWCEGYGEAAVCSRCQVRTAPIGLAEIRSVGSSQSYAADGNCRSTIVGNRLGLSNARSSDELRAEAQAGRR